MFKSSPALCVVSVPAAGHSFISTSSCSEEDVPDGHACNALLTLIFVTPLDVDRHSFSFLLPYPLSDLSIQNDRVHSIPQTRGFRSLLYIGLTLKQILISLHALQIEPQGIIHQKKKLLNNNIELSGARIMR